MHLLTGGRRCKMISEYFAGTSAFVRSSCARSSHKIVFSMIFRVRRRAGRQSAAFSRVEYEIEFISLPRQSRPGRELQLVKEKEICIQNIYSDTHAFALESSCYDKLKLFLRHFLFGSHRAQRPPISATKEMHASGFKCHESLSMSLHFFLSGEIRGIRCFDFN